MAYLPQSECLTSSESLKQADVVSGSVLKPENWQADALEYYQEVCQLVDAFSKARTRHQADPVMEFLFKYYQQGPAKLKRWSPGAGIRLEGAGMYDDSPERAPDYFFRHKAYRRAGDDLMLHPADFPAKKQRGTRWMLALLKATHERKPTLNCCGMHEWAMVYELEEGQQRHQQFPLRLSRAEIKELVDSNPVKCTHFDAFRFFTPPARPLNQHTLSRDSMQEMEQPGCLHTNMDLYKWAFKMQPWISSHLMLAAFKLACKARLLDMQAGPYDLRSLGYEPLLIETEAGRQEYKTRQAGIWKEAAPVRQALIHHFEKLLYAVEATDSAPNPSP